MSTRLRSAALALILLLVLPEVVAACPVCFDPREENRLAFIATTAFLSLLPLGMVAGAGLWLRRRVRTLDAQELDRMNGGSEGPDESVS